MSLHTPPRRTPSRRAARITGVAVVAGGLVASAALVWQASYSAFSATTSSQSNAWTSGTVALTNDNTTGSGVFAVTNMKPGASGSKCIVVTSTGSLASAVRLYTTAGTFSQTNAVADNISITVTQGTNSQASTAGSCANFVADAGPVTSTGTLSAFAGARTSYATGFGAWTTAGVTAGEPKVYKFDYTFSANATNAQQGGSAAIGFTWEAQNT